MTGMITAGREKDLFDAADLLLDARRTNQPIADLPHRLQPMSLEEAYVVQDRMSLAYEDIGGWKIGAPTPEASPSFAPMPAAWICASGCQLTGVEHRFRGIEAEIAFKMGKDLPPRETPYTREEVLAAVESMHPAIEVLESALIDPVGAPKLTSAADMAMHGGFVYGAAVPGWQNIDFTKETVVVSVDGAVRVERTGSNTSGDFLRLLPWLANEGANRTEGLRRGDWITTGSWTGITLASAGSEVEAQFGHAGRVTLRFP
jgi:2-keto-4-pentenoate hydratase